MYISSKVLAQAITTVLMFLITLMVTHFGLSLSASDQALLSGSLSVVAGAAAGYIKKETDPTALVAAAEHLSAHRQAAVTTLPAAYTFSGEIQGCPCKAP